MVDPDFVAFFLDTMLQNHFQTKSRMARTLGLTLRTVQTVYQKGSTQKGASLVFVNTICYCCSHGISVDAVYMQYTTFADKNRAITSQPLRPTVEFTNSTMEKAAAIWQRLWGYAKLFVFSASAKCCTIDLISK